MKKRVLSMLLAFILCFSTLPMTAFAQETDAVVEQEEQQEADSAEEQKEQQEADSAEGQEEQQEAAPVTEQKEAEAAAAPGEETSSDKSTTAGEAPDTVESAVESVSDSDAGTQDTGADDEKKAAVQKVQALINALPEEATAKNADELRAQLMAIEEALAALNDEQRAELDMTRLENICAALNGAVAVQATHTNHTDSSMNEWKETNALPDVAGSYYLSQNVTLDKTWVPADNTVLCLNGYSITMNEDATAVITIKSGVTFTLYDCSDTGNGKITHGTNGTTGSKYTGRGVSVDGTFNMYGGKITGNETYEITVGGGGVYVAKNGVLNMSGSAVISGNTVYKGTASSAGSGGGVNVNGGTFNMKGGTISNNTADIYGSGVYVDAKGVFNMSGGTITENLRNGGVALSDASTFNMYDTAVISNNEHGADGGGVYVRSSIFNMYGGTIIGNRVTSSANDGGGVALMGTGSIFTMYGGSIVGNETLRSGGGVYVDNQNVFYMQGGTITGNNVNGDSDDSTYKKYYNGGGVFVGGGYKDSSSTYISATFKVSGSARITGNTKGATTKDDKTGCYTGGTSNNVFLLKYNDNAQQATITIANTLTDGASIGVLTGKMPDEDSNVTFATAATGYTLTEEDADCFTSDADGIYPVLANNKMQLSTTAPHRHCLCGKEHHDVGNHTTDSQVTFTKLWMDNGKLKIGDTELPATITQDKGYFDQGQNVTCYELPAGNYYLGSSITLDYPIYIASHWGTAPASKDVKLCLNGKTITANGDFSAIVCSSVVSKTTFTLTDCQQTAGTITHAANKTGSGVLLYSNGNGTRFNMYGGSLTHNTAERGGGVNIVANGDGGIFNLYGGVISGNKADGAGGGVYMNGRNSTFTMYAGKITSNTAGKDGGGVSSASAKFIMNGGSITGNTAVTGGGVSVGCYSSTDFTMNGGEIKNNMASDNGGGVYMGGRLRSYTFTLNGTPDISGNTKAGVANNVYLSSGAVITVGNLGANVQIPVTLEKMPTEGFYVKFAKAGMGVELNDPIAHQFIIENDGSNGCDKKIIENEPNELWLYVTGDKLHQHAICGEFCDHEPNHSKELWTPLIYDAGTQQLMYGSLHVPSEVTAIGAADDQGNPTTAYYTTYKLPAGNYYLADTIEMKGGSATYNGIAVTSKGGVIEIGTDVNLCLNGKRLSTSAPYVGVIVIKKAGTLTLSDCGTGGRISSSCNAGVQIANDTSQAGTFTMYDGGIMNTATGVLMGSNSIFNMYGGTIANNETGVSVVSTSKLTVGGSADITGNNNENVFLYDKAMITIDSNLKNDARIGVTTENRPIDKKPIQIATGATGAVLYTEIFKPDKADQGYVVTEDEQGKLYLNVHIHNWLYGRSADGQTIIANCNVTGCPKPDGGWVTIDKPKHEVYGDGKSAEATLKAFNWQPDAVTVSNIKYEQPGKILSGAPTDAGTYWASITIGYATASVTYTINSKEVTDPTIEVADAGTYDGKAKTPSVTVKDGDTVIPSNEYSVSYENNTNAGTATVKITDVAGGNYDVSGNTTFTIGKATITVTPEDDQKTIYGSADLPLRYSCSGAVNGEKPAFAGALSRIKGKDTGKYDITLGTLALADNSAGNFRADNYELKFADTPVQFTIVPKTLSAENLEFITDSLITKTYDGTTECTTATVQIKNSAKAYPNDEVPTVTGIYAYNSAKVTEANEVIFTSEASGNQNYILPAGLKLGHAANITKADQAALTITSTSATYGTDLSLTVDGGSGDGALTYTVVNDTGAATISGSTLQPVRAGQVTVQATKAGDDNYNEVKSSITVIAINKGTYPGTVSKTINIIKNRSGKQMGTLTAADFFPEGKAPVGTEISGLGNATGEIVNVTRNQDLFKGYILNYFTVDDNITSETDQTCKVTISSTNYQDIEATLTFHPTDKETVTIKGLTYTDKTYDGSAMEPAGTLKVSDDKVPVKELEVLYEGTSANGTNYSSSSAPKDAGAYKVTYKVADSNENYTGSVEYTFTISPKNVTAGMIDTIAAQEYTGSAITPEPAVKDGEVTLISGKDFDFSYDKNINASENTATLTITGQGNYTGTASRTFTIKPKDIKGAAITLQTDSLGYTGLMQEVQITSVTLDQVPLTANDYDIVNNSNKQINADDSITLTIAGKGNYTGTATTTWKITRATPVLDNFDVTPDLSQKQTYDGKPKEVTAKTKNGVIAMGDVKVYYEGTSGTTYVRSETAPTNAGSYKVILNVAEGTNYTAAVIEAGTLKIDKAVLTLENIEKKYGFTESGEQTISIAGRVPDATGYTLGTVTGNTEIISGASVDQDGTLRFTLNEGEAGKKLTLPVTISSANYKDTTVDVVIIQEYRIIDGANSSWTQNTDGTIVIRGNGAYRLFREVKVDGNIIDAANYEVKEGSTIITLKAEYLKTLAAGSHTFEIVWNDGSAGTDFTVVVNTPSNNGNSSDNSNDNSSGDSSNTTDIAAPVANDPAQELDKVPATGDPFGIWLTLFAVSLAGLAAMLVRKKNNRE